MTKPAPKILLIVGSARSGSTILGLLLGRMAGVAHVGEVMQFWKRGLEENHYCGCGDRMLDCAFWKNVCAGQPWADPSTARVKTTYLARALRRYSLHKSFGRALGRLSAEEEADIAGATSALYDQIGRVSSADWIIDTSKQPIYGRFMCATLDRARIHVLHIVRDPRGVAHSAAKRRAKTDAGQANARMVRRTPIHSALGWVKTELSAATLRGRAASYHRLRYEDLCREGVAGLLPVLGRIDPDLKARFAATLNGSSIAATDALPQHTVSGNPIRMDGSVPTLRLDKAWRTELAWPARFMVSIITFPFLVPYRYHLWSR